MSPGTPQKFPQESWNAWEERIERLVKAEFLQWSGQTFYETHSQQVIENVKNNHFYSGKWPSDDLFVPPLVESEVKKCIEEKRQQLWDAHEELAISVVQEVMPPAAREFDNYYTKVILKLLSKRFVAERPECWLTEHLEDLMKQLAKGLDLEMNIRALTNDHGELRDEELVRLSRAGFPKCRTLLLERYDMILRNLVPRIVYAKGICPESTDANEFAKDVAQQVLLNLFTELESYRFESSFETWIGTICENEAYAQQRKLLGRSRAGKRRYGSFEELQHELEAPIRSEDNRDILHKIIEKHRQQGPRAEKSTAAIEWRYFDGIDSKTIAKRLDTTLAYVHQLFSHDYPELLKIAREDFGISGTDL
jgi:RNA polymerase sigma factor (sigma-70 family)